MTLKRRFLVYLGLVFLLLAILSVQFFMARPDYLIWLVPVELALFLVAFFGYRLVCSIFEPMQMVVATTELLREEEFTTRVRPVGQKEVDALIHVYNRMAEQLRCQRVTNQEQESFLEKILAATTTGIITFDYDERITRVNPAASRLLGETEAGLKGKSLEQLTSPLAGILAELAVGERRILPVQGRRRLKCVRAHFLDRGFYRSFLFIDELTEELRQTEKEAYNKLVRIMSHEINNSIGAANSLLHSLRRYGDQICEADREDFDSALQVIISRADHLLRFTSEYAGVVKLPAPQRHPTDLAILVDHLYLLIKAELQARRIEWRRKGVELLMLNLDRAQMEQALLNILKNALEAVGQDGFITLYLEDQGRPALWVEDSGVGIPSEIEDTLFTPFTTSKKGGQGIGLTLVGEILNGHGFDYALENTKRGLTRFSIWF